MDITSFRIGASHTINLGNYESLRVEAQVEVSVPVGGDYREQSAQAQTELRQLLDETYLAQRRRQK